MASHVLHHAGLQSPSQIYRANSPWMTGAKPSLIRCTTSQSLPPTKTTATSLHAQGRGFGLTTPSDDKPRPQGNGSNEEGEDEEDAIPDVVFNRMIVRVVSFVGAPMASGVGLLYVLSSLKEQGVWESPRWLPFLTVLLAFGSSALGIAYGTLSASWDPNDNGSLLGWKEARQNWPELWKEDEEGKR